MEPSSQTFSKKRADPVPKSKYEFTLAEFPITILSKRAPEGLKILEYHDTITGEGGEPVRRTWRVKPSIEHGFGSSAALSTIYELFQIWKEDGFETPIVRFGSIYNLCKRMGLKDKPSAYKRIRKDLNALVESSIECKNAFWDNERKAYVDKTFHLFDEVVFYHKEKVGEWQSILPFSYIKAGDVIWGSIQANALISASFTREWFHSLTPTAQRLALYLTKMLRHQPFHKRKLSKLIEQIPLHTKRYRKAKEQIAKATQELLDKGHPSLKSFHFEKQTNRQRRENIVFLKGSQQKPESQEKPAAENPNSGDLKAKQQLLVEDILEITGDSHSRDFYTLVVRKMDDLTIRQALSETKAGDFPRRGTLRNKGAYFTDLILKHATKQGIQLTHKRSKRPKEEIFKQLKAKTDAQMEKKAFLYIGMRQEEREDAWRHLFEQIAAAAGYDPEEFQPFLETNGSK